MAATLIEFAQELKRQAAIDQVIGDYVPSLRRRGKTFKALCPFHDEKTPSFNVQPEFGFYHCFGCGAHGDVIKFVQEFEKVDFRMAIETIAKRFGIAVPEFRSNRSARERDEDEKRNSRILAICELARRFFTHQLWDSPEGAGARRYLETRGLKPDQIKAYRIGFAPAQYEGFLREAGKKGYREADVAEAGLAIQRDRGGFYDRFRNRIIFPIEDTHGRTVAFGGRLLEGEGPKYLNSPETPLFRKGKLLYGLSQAREAIRDEGRVILLEGYMDWIALHSFGIANVLAGLGTAFAKDQARLLRRFTREVILHFDGDQAGRKAMLRAAELLLAEGLQVRVAALASEEDPDTHIRSRGIEATRQMLSEAPGAIDFFLGEELASGPAATTQDKIRILDAIAPLIRAIPDETARSVYEGDVRTRLGIHDSTLLGRRGGPRGKSSGRRYPPTVATETGSSTQIEEFDRLECGLLNRLARIVDRWDLFNQLDADLFSHPTIRSIFLIFHEQARLTSEGNAPPSDWLALCKSEEETHAMSRVLLFEDLDLAGELNPENLVVTVEDDVAACLITATRLRRRRIRQRRNELVHQTRAQPGTLEDSRTGLTAIHSHSRSVLRETENLYKASPE